MPISGLKTSIKSEAYVKLSRPSIGGRDEGCPLPVVTFNTRRRNYRVPEKHLLRHSVKYQRVVSSGGRVPVSIDLMTYDVTAVRAFVDALCNVADGNLRLDSCNLNDFLHLVVIFEADKLILNVLNYLRSVLETGSMCSLISTLCLTAKHWCLACIPEWRFALLKLTISEFEGIRISRYFAQIPLSVLTQIFSSCDLSAPELSIAFWGIDWCAMNDILERPDKLSDLIRLLLCVRSAKLLPGDKKRIRDYLLWRGVEDRSVARCMTRLQENRNYRCCVISSHLQEGRVRCGVPNHPGLSQIGSIDLTITYGEDVRTAEENSPRSKKHGKEWPPKEKFPDLFDVVSATEHSSKMRKSNL